MPDIPTSPGFDEIVVGFEDETENITDQLVRGPKELNVISIIGMAGLGKTTLARKVFSHKPVIEHFDLCAWCCVSQEYDKNRVFTDLFSQVTDDKDDEDDTDEVLLKNLMKKCKDDQSWTAIGEELRISLMGKCTGMHKSKDDIVNDTIEVLYKSLIKLGEDDRSWNKISNTLRESIVNNWKDIKKWGDIAKLIYESLVVNFKDNNARDDAPKMSPKDMKLLEEISAVRTDDDVQKTFSTSLLDLAEMLNLTKQMLNLHKQCQDDKTREKMMEEMREKMMKALSNGINGVVGTLHICLSKKCRESDSWDAKIAEKLRKRLLGHRYLIVLDDVWRTQAWDELSRPFPSGEDGSRVILTSREYNVGKYARSGAEPHSLRFFTTEESQDLLQLRLSKENVIPHELKEFGRQIAEKCGGVPLVVVLVAGLLQTKIEEECFSWKEFLQSLSSHIRGDDSRSMDVIALSYNHLPEHLKPCLLYFGAFPEDHEIPVSNLIQLWMAEGFVKRIEKEILEDEAEDFLDHLICSSLVMVSTRGYNGSVRTCRIHDLVGSFCLTKAKENKFLMQTDSDHASVHPPSYDRFCLLKRDGKDLSHESWMALNPSLGTLLCFSSLNPNLTAPSSLNLNLSSSYDPCSGSWVASAFKLVRVLDLESVVVGQSFFFEVESLYCLRYLAVCLNGSGSISPPSLGSLVHLETFKVKSSSDLHLPFMIWNLKSLRHLHIDHYCYHCFYGRGVQTSIPPKPLNLQTCSIPVLLNSFREEHLLRKLPHLRKLRCRFSTLWYRKCHRFPELGFLDKLESLEVCYAREHLNAPNSSIFSFPQSLKQLSLHKFRLAWDNISAIATLPELESLELFSAFDGDQWDVEEGNFCKLKFLRLCESRIVRWNATADSFPKLERLVVAKCRHLQEVPSSFEDINTLQAIEIDQCNSSVARSVEQIQEDMAALGNVNLNVRVLNCDLEIGKWYL